MDSLHLPLLLGSQRYRGEAEREPLDRLRMQKGVFLLEQRGPQAWRDLYEFYAYDWGPYSSALSADVQRAMRDDLLEREPWPGRRYSGYRTTSIGEKTITGVVGDLPGEYHDFIRRVRAFVTTRSFTQLLRDVYAEYPEYAVNSRFNG